MGRWPNRTAAERVAHRKNKAKEKYLRHRAHILQQKAEYYQRNKKRIRLKNNLWAKNNAEKLKKYDRDYRRKNNRENKSHLAELRKRWVAANKERILAISRSHYKRNRKSIRAKQNDRWRKDSARRNQLRLVNRYELWESVINGFGGKCTCCDESNHGFLTLDHVNGGGAIEAKKLGRDQVLRRVVACGFDRKLYTLLCYNCNCGRQRNGGVCPHTKPYVMPHLRSAV